MEIRRVKDPTGMLEFCATVTAGLGSGQDVQRFVNVALRRNPGTVGSHQGGLRGVRRGDCRGQRPVNAH